MYLKANGHYRFSPDATNKFCLLTRRRQKSGTLNMFKISRWSTFLCCCVGTEFVVCIDLKEDNFWTFDRLTYHLGKYVFNQIHSDLHAVIIGPFMFMFIFLLILFYDINLREVCFSGHVVQHCTSNNNLANSTRKQLQNSPSFMKASGINLNKCV